jgi:hypothetical protein
VRILDVKLGSGRHWTIQTPPAPGATLPAVAPPEAPSRTAQIVGAPVLTVSDRLMMLWIGLVGLAVVMATGGGRSTDTDTDTRPVAAAIEASRAPDDAALIAQLRKLQPVPPPEAQAIAPVPPVEAPVEAEAPTSPPDARLTITVSGEVHQPGAMRVEPGTAVLPALMQAGGTTAAGSLRRVDLRRAGQDAKQLDLYDGLIDGPDAGLALQEGDELHVPAAGPSVSISGRVKRAGVLELAPGDTVARLIEFAGLDGKIKRVEIARGDAKKSRIVAKGPLESTRWPPLQDGDRIRIE